MWEEKGEEEKEEEVVVEEEGKSVLVLLWMLNPVVQVQMFSLIILNTTQWTRELVGKIIT